MNSFSNLNNLLNKVFQDQPKNIRLGIWGTEGSGKTLYLIMLYEALLVSKDWQVTSDKTACQFVEEHLDEIDNTDKPGLLPLPTEKNKQIEIFRYILTPTSDNNITNSKVVLEFIDAPGEFYREILKADAKVVKKTYSSIKSENEDFIEEYEDIVEYLMSCDGIIFLLDPKPRNNTTESYRTLLFELFNEFQARSQDLYSKDRRIKQYMAFCVTKVDDDDNLWEKAENPQKLVEEVMGERMWSYLPNFCYLQLDPEKRNKLHKHNRCEFFAVSAIGRYQDKKDKRKWYRALEEPVQNTTNTHSQNNYSSGYPGGYDPDSQHEPKQTGSNTPPSSLGLGLNVQNNHQKPTRTGLTIKPRVQCKPINVIDPIEWLIKSILYHQPTLDPKN